MAHEGSPLEPSAVADRMAIQDVIARYSRAVDSRNWDDLDSLFTTDASIDYTDMGGIRGDVSSVKKFLSETFQLFTSSLHLMGLPVIEVVGDTARAVTPCHNPMVFAEEGGLMMCGLWYHEEFVRTETGWRIRELREERCYIKTFPTMKTP